MWKNVSPFKYMFFFGYLCEISGVSIMVLWLVVLFFYQSHRSQTAPNNSMIPWCMSADPKINFFDLDLLVPCLKLTVRTCQVAPCQKETIVFQASIFRCELLVSGREHILPNGRPWWRWIHGTIRRESPSLTKQIHEEILGAFDWKASENNRNQEGDVCDVLGL